MGYKVQPNPYITPSGDMGSVRVFKGGKYNNDQVFHLFDVQNDMNFYFPSSMEGIIPDADLMPGAPTYGAGFIEQLGGWVSKDTNYKTKGRRNYLTMYNVNARLLGYPELWNNHYRAAFTK